MAEEKESLNEPEGSERFLWIGYLLLVEYVYIRYRENNKVHKIKRDKMKYQKVVDLANQLGIEPPTFEEFEANRPKSLPNEILERNKKSNHLLASGWVAQKGYWSNHIEGDYHLYIDDAIMIQLERDFLQGE